MRQRLHVGAVTVNPLANPGTITGTSPICEGTSATFADGGDPGSWSSSATSIATIDASTGIVTAGSTAGSTTISYAATNGCGTEYATALLTVEVPAQAIYGGTTVCEGATVHLSDAPTGGTWISGTTAVGTVDGSGVVTGITSGNTGITYTVTNSCGTTSAAITMSVLPLPDPGTITGSTPVCVGSATTLSDPTGDPGGTWSSSATDVGTVDGYGSVTGISQGTTVIYYLVSNTCGYAETSTTVTVNPLPNPGGITGAYAVCATFTATLTAVAADAGGTWSSGSTGVATVGTSGIATGITGGTAVISYTVTNSCGTASSTFTLGVDEVPSMGITDAGTFAGPYYGAAHLLEMCQTTGSLTLTGTPAGGNWSSSNTSVATISSGGVVTPTASTFYYIEYVVFQYYIENTCGNYDTSRFVYMDPPAVNVGISGPTYLSYGSIGDYIGLNGGELYFSDAMSDHSYGGSAPLTLLGSEGEAFTEGPYYTPGTINITFTSTNTCGIANSTSINVTVGP